MWLYKSSFYFVFQIQVSQKCCVLLKSNLQPDNMDTRGANPGEDAAPQLYFK